MAFEYIKGKNPFEEYILYNLLENVDFQEDGVIDEMVDAMTHILEIVLGTNEYNHLFSVDIQIDNEIYNIKGNNLISSLWLIGIFPENIEKTIIDGYYHENGISYKYDNEINILVIKELLN